MKILVTGGLGQIGSHVTEVLLHRNDEVLVVDNLATGRREHLSENEKLKVVIDTIANPKLVDSLFASFRPDVVVHAAASYKDPDDWHGDAMTNCVGGANIVRASLNHGVDRLIYFQTSLCYGLNAQEKPITLHHPKFPASTSYAITKTANEDFIEISGLNFVTFRLANVIGPRNVAGPLPVFYQRLKDGKQCFVTESRRDFVFVKDLARVVLKACDGVGSGTYHFSSGTDVAIRELYDAVVKEMNFSHYPEPVVQALGEDDVYSILLDPSRTFEDFGNIEFTSVEDAVSESVAYFREYGILGEYTHLRLGKE